MADVNAIIDTLVAIIALWGWCYCRIIVCEADVITTYLLILAGVIALLSFNVVDVITTVADGIATQADVIACLAFYVVDVITTVADGIATQGELIVWIWCVADGMATVSKLCQL